MVTKSKSPSADNNKRTKIKKLNLTKERLKDLSDNDIRKVKGGAVNRSSTVVRTSGSSPVSG